MQKKETSTRSFGDSMKKFFLQSWSSSVVAIVLLVIIFSITTSAFLSQYNLFNLSRTAAVYAFIAGAQLMVAVNDDNTDNYFAEPTARFADIEEDEPVLYPLCNEYDKWFPKND